MGNTDTSKKQGGKPVGVKRLVMARTRLPDPRTFESFPENEICPVCGTNADGTTTLIAIRGTEDGRLVEAHPVHLQCALIGCWVPDKGGVRFGIPEAERLRLREKLREAKCHNDQAQAQPPTATPERKGDNQ